MSIGARIYIANKYIIITFFLVTMILVRSFHRRIAMTNHRHGTCRARWILPSQSDFFPYPRVDNQIPDHMLKGSSLLPPGPIHCWLYNYTFI